MDKIAVGARGKGSIDMNKSITENVNNLADQLGQSVRDLTAVILERDRHSQMIEELRATGGGDVPSTKVGLAVLDRLRDLDEVAYMRFASVYKNFDAAEDFQREAALLDKSPVA